MHPDADEADDPDNEGVMTTPLKTLKTAELKMYSLSEKENLPMSLKYLDKANAKIVQGGRGGEHNNQ